MFNRIKKIILLFIIVPILLSGCWDEKLIEDTGFITILGIESSPTGELDLTYGMPVIGGDVSGRGEILDTTASLLRTARDKLKLQSDKTLEAGKIQFLAYSKEIAEKDSISNINEVFERDPINSIIAWIVVVDGSPRSLFHLANEYKDKQRPSIYISKLLERAVASGNTPEKRIYNFDLKSFAPGIDNVTPLIKFDSKAVEIKGTALFSSGKMVGTINTKETGLLIAMMQTLKNKKYTYEASDINNIDNEKPKRGLSILMSEKSKKINILIKNDVPVVDINLNLTGSIDEYKWDDLNDENKVKQLSKHIQGQIENDCQNLIKYMQSIESDPIGLGDMVRAKHNDYFKRVDWHEAYKNASITVHVKFNIIKYGTIS